jgi:hypothetical protein
LGSRHRLIGPLAVAVLILATACYGPYHVTPDESPGAGGLKATLSDHDAGRVGIAPGLDLNAYRVVGVARFPVVDPSVKEGAERQRADAMSSFLQSEIVRRLVQSGLFARVVNLSDAELEPGDDRALRLEGEITRFDEGSQTLRALLGVYGAGPARIQVETRFVDVQSGAVVIVTADRRQATMGIWGGTSTEHIRNGLDDIARDLARFLVRLSNGQAPSS